MDSRQALLHRFRALKLLRASLVLGALYDLGFALAVVAFPAPAAEMLELPLPGERFYLWILATSLLMLASLYFLAARDPRRYSAVILVAIVGRTLGAVAFGAGAVGRPELGSLWYLAAADLSFAVAHGVLWPKVR